MDAYSKYVENERKQRVSCIQNSTQTQTSEIQQDVSDYLSRKDFVRYKKSQNEKFKTQSRPKELHQKGTQTCIRLNRPQSECHSQRTSEMLHTPKLQLHTQQTETQTLHPAHRCPYKASHHRLPPAPVSRLRSPRQVSRNYTYPKPFFNVDYAVSSRRAHRLPPLPLYDKGFEPDRGAAGGDCVLYKNSNFGKESSRARSDTSDILLFDPPAIDTMSRTSRRKSSESLTKLESARERCRETKARFNAKYADNGSLSMDTDSLHSTKSAKTVISAKSGDNLRTVVRSQIEMRELLHQSIAKMTELTDRLALNANDKMMLPSLGLSDASDVNQPTDRQPPKPPNPKPAEKKVVEIESANLEAIKVFPVTVEDIVSTKVIAPMMRRVQRMYLNNLQEEMKLMEDLERVPCQVSEVYKSVDAPDTSTTSKKEQ